MLPTAACDEHDDNPNETLLESRATPDNTCACASSKMDMVGLEEIDLIVGERKEPIDNAGDMVRHNIERARDVQTKP
mgnify:CR=1 FL=1